MKRSNLILIIVLGVIGLLLLFGVTTYNGLAKSGNDVDASWSNVQTQYQRRADLIPGLVKTVKGMAANENKILTELTEARSGIINAKNPSELDAAGARLNNAIRVTFEAYPQIRSNEGFLKLQDQLEGTENRINYARDEYNKVVKGYNEKIVTFPRNIFAGMFGFTKKDFFQAKTGSENMPEINF